MSDYETRPGDESFLERWMRRKAAARDAATCAEELPRPADTAPEAPATDPTNPPAEDETPALPDLEALDQDSDYSAFLLPKVDAALQRKALRKLFHSPKFNVCDGLDDYCGDFTQFEALGNVVTAEMRHRLERAARAAEHLADSEESPLSADQRAETPPVSRAHDPDTPADADAADPDDDSVRSS